MQALWKGICPQKCLQESQEGKSLLMSLYFFFFGWFADMISSCLSFKEVSVYLGREVPGGIREVPAWPWTPHSGPAPGGLLPSVLLTSRVSPRVLQGCTTAVFIPFLFSFKSDTLVHVPSLKFSSCVVSSHSARPGLLPISLNTSVPSPRSFILDVLAGPLLCSLCQLHPGLLLSALFWWTPNDLFF